MRTLQKFLMATGVLLLASPAFAATVRPYDAGEFQMLKQKAEQPVVLAFHQEGCSVCAAQEPALEAALENPEFAGVEARRVEFDPGSPIAKEYGVTKQSTLVVLRGGKVVAKAVGVTNQAKISDLIMKGL